MSELLAGLLGVLIGSFLSHRFSIGRDHRKEFNEIADEISLSLIKKKKGASDKLIWSGPTDEQLEILKRRSSFLKRNSVTKACDSYINAITDLTNQESDSVGQHFYKNPDKIITVIDNLLNQVKRK